MQPISLTLTISLLVPGLLAMAGCATPHGAKAKPHPETVLVAYRVKSGKETEFRDLLARAWEVYRAGKLVFESPHVVMQDTEDGKPRFYEIFTWKDRSTPEHAPDAVLALWKQEEALCERRGGHYGIEPGEVQLLVPSRHKHD